MFAEFRGGGAGSAPSEYAPGTCVHDYVIVVSAMFFEVTLSDVDGKFYKYGRSVQ